MCIEKLAITIRNEKDVPLVSKVLTYAIGTIFVGGYNHDSTAIRLRFDYDSITIRLRFDCDSTSIGLRFDYDSIALRPFDDLRKPTCVCGLLRYGLNK